MKTKIVLALCFIVTVIGGQKPIAAGPTTQLPTAAETVWQKINAPSGSRRIRMVAVNNSGHLFLAERFLGFFRSIDGGATWTPINSGIKGRAAWTINVNPKNGDLIASTYASRGGDFVSYYCSNDNGDHWTKIKGSYRFSKASVYSGVAFAQNGNAVFGGFWSPSPENAIWYSTDCRKSDMATLNPTATAVMGIAYNPVGKDLWAGTEAAGIYRSTDNGRTWNRTFEPRTSGIRMGNIRGFAFSRSGQVLLASMTGVWRSTDATGTAWTHVFKNANTSNGRSLFQDESFNIYYGHKRDPQNPTSVFISKDGGDSWQSYDSGLERALDVEGFALNPVDGRLYVAPDGPDIYRTVNKGQ
jgi:photosystem II stability/assembly factor-like uncharacterized protein